MKLTRNRISASWLRITLNASDTYTMEFLKMSKGEVKTAAEHNGVYNDMLQDIFTRETGLYTSLGTCGR